MIWYCLSSIEYWRFFILAKYYINPVIYSYLIKVGFESVMLWKGLCLGSINIARVGVKVGVGLKKLFYEIKEKTVS